MDASLGAYLAISNGKTVLDEQAAGAPGKKPLDGLACQELPTDSCCSG